MTLSRMVPCSCPSGLRVNGAAEPFAVKTAPTEVGAGALSRSRPLPQGVGAGALLRSRPLPPGLVRALFRGQDRSHRGAGAGAFSRSRPLPQGLVRALYCGRGLPQSWCGRSFAVETAPTGMRLAAKTMRGTAVVGAVLTASFPAKPRSGHPARRIKRRAVRRCDRAAPHISSSTNSSAGTGRLIR